MTARQSRIGTKFRGSELVGAQISGQAEVDFFGGKTALANGINMDLVRLRLASWSNGLEELFADWRTRLVDLCAVESDDAY